VSLWGMLIPIRREFDQYVNLRPARLLPNVPSPIAPSRVSDLDMVVIRENVEGEYSRIGGRLYSGSDAEMAVQESVFTRRGLERVMRYAFDLAGRRRAHLTSATKSNGIAISMPYWDTRVEAVAAEHADAGLTVDKFHIDNLVAQLILRPAFFDVVVGSNLFGDILSDLGPALTGTIGIAPSANINPERTHPSLFEPVHGSAPDIAGQGIANPVGMIWAAQMLLEHLGEADAAAAVMRAIELTLADAATRTRDLGGEADTRTCGAAVAAAIG
jgi:tartrate dehydrogenase/decarboxylase / D-malate dehydrogenase